MPEISRFYGIVIKMFFKPKEHEPSHIHALYGEYVGEFNIQTFEMMEGDLPPKAQALVREWLAIYSKQLQAMWDAQVIEKLPPLE
ncbi:DUF4160 domain-containing protein [Adlercreutzia equolifaciens]|uniref:DUF4160 domain-containing protein n=1 Tax=Adlercreutzia equolifaciens TaxID=446660 RepID=UPI0023B0EBA4|nr:DUF4160 domain-containing protein [Adlercreutzia equolifaciens]MCI9261557.1 DUF4160 domain-containing protein [Eggerthellaceae bacterium]MDE8701847.1 DUF4160 domain-containing protein [Adlercreutzia equolifaciens]